MKNRKESLLLGQIIRKIATREGLHVLLEPEWGIVGRITFVNGKHSYFRYNTLDLNPVGASDVAKDKDYANFFMKDFGYPTVRGKTFFSKEWGRAIGAARRTENAAYHYACRLGFPVIVKPNSGSQGAAVSLVHNKREFFKALRRVFKHDRVALVQEYLRGKDYRIVVLDKTIISAYERIPLNIVGDGKLTIGQLLKAKQEGFTRSGRDTQIKMSDPRIKIKLSHQGLNFRSIPGKGERVYLLDNANLSTGGDSVDVTKSLHPSFRRTAIKLTADMGLRLCGVDLMIQGDISHKPGIFWVLEINAAPGLDHYAKMGKAQKRTVEDLYTTVLKHLGR